MNRKYPTIKGIFVRSHVQSLRRVKGEPGVRELARRLGRPLRFTLLEDVPVADEVRLIEASLDILTCRRVPADRRAFEAGRLHFRNFFETPLGRILFAGLHDFRKLILNAKYIAEHVFQGVTFSAKEAGPHAVAISMEGGDYPLAHFQGLFREWAVYMGQDARVEASQSAPGRYDYVISWKQK